VAVIFWKDSMDFNKIIRQKVEIKVEEMVIEQISPKREEKPQNKNLFLRQIGK
jgi:hypothetical protein